MYNFKQKSTIHEFTNDSLSGLFQSFLIRTILQYSITKLTIFVYTPAIRVVWLATIFSWMLAALLVPLLTHESALVEFSWTVGEQAVSDVLSTWGGYNKLKTHNIKLKDTLLNIKCLISRANWRIQKWSRHHFISSSTLLSLNTHSEPAQYIKWSANP